MLKKYFSTGLAILLPIILTAMIVLFFVNLVTAPFLETVKSLLGSFLFTKSEALITVLSKFLILFFIFGFILLLGLMGKLFLVDYLLKWGDYFFHRVPYFNKIYVACQDVVKSLFSSTSQSFTQAVLVPYPQSGNLSVGFVTCESLKIIDFEHTNEFVSVFVPETPNLSGGFMLLFKRDQLVFSNMKVDEAMKFVVSCGITMPESTTFQPYAAYEK